MGIRKQISVSVLKAKLLEVVREVERGESFEVTKDGRKVGILAPLREDPPLTGFSKVVINKDIAAPIDEKWTFDAENLKPRK